MKEILHFNQIVDNIHKIEFFRSNNQILILSDLDIILFRQKYLHNILSGYQ